MNNNTILPSAIIAKIDNDFNPQNSDWIPRVGAWILDALSQLKINMTKTIRLKVEINERVGIIECPIDISSIKVLDKNCCEIKEAGSKCDVCNTPRTGGMPIGFCTTGTDNNYVLIGCNKIELNFDTDFIYIEAKTPETQYDEELGCEFPLIPNNGDVIEAITNYCMYKMLSRGYKHPVFNLAASQYGTNPYYLWESNKAKAKASYIISEQERKGIDTSIMRSTFFIHTFDTRK